MIIGVKYCGGCNSVYNRGRQVNLLKEKFPEHTYRTAAEGNTCDVWIVACGCMRACASTEGLIATKRIFVLPTERSFVQVHTYLREEREKEAAEGAVSDLQQNGAATENGPEKRALRVGDTAEYTKTFFKDDVDRFAALTGDTSRLHTDAEFAKRSVYGRPVVHGVLAASLISTAMGTKLPGEGTVLIEEQIRFLKPVFYGDMVTAKIMLSACREGKDQYVGTFYGICVNQNGEVVSAAKCRQLMPKELFTVENPQETAKLPEAAGYWE